MIVIVEGNIGAGKTTLVGLVGEYLGSLVGSDSVVTVAEPVTDWSSRDNLLRRYYENRKEYGLQLQMLATLNMLENERYAVRMSREGKIVVMDRSLFTAVNVFGSLLQKENNISGFDKYLQSLITARYKPVIGPAFGGLYDRYCRLYVRTPIDLCMDRIRRRARPGEQMITTDYLASIERTTEAQMLNEPEEARHTFVMDGDYDGDKPLSANVRAPTPSRRRLSLEEFLHTIVIG